jgi:hypothetical protein
MQFFLLPDSRESTPLKIPLNRPAPRYIQNKIAIFSGHVILCGCSHGLPSYCLQLCPLRTFPQKPLVSQTAKHCQTGYALLLAGRKFSPFSPACWDGYCIAFSGVGLPVQFLSLFFNPSKLFINCTNF